jgi:hypothetical protein
MLFYTTYKPKPGFGHEDQKQALELWSKWQPPAGIEIKAFYLSADARGFVISEAKTAEAIFESIAPWAGNLLDYEIVPIVEMDKALPPLQKAVAS